MPLQRCIANGREGWQWGKKGRCYVGEGAAAKAMRQAKVIKVRQTQNKEQSDDTSDRYALASSSDGTNANKAIQTQTSLRSEPPALVVETPSLLDHGVPLQTRNAFKVVVDQRPPGTLFRDPTRSLMLRKAFFGAFSRRFRRMKGLITRLVVEEDALGLRPENQITNKERSNGTTDERRGGSVQQRMVGGLENRTNLRGDSSNYGVSGSNSTVLNVRWAFRSSAEKLVEFQRWLAVQIEKELLPGSMFVGMSEAEQIAWWEQFNRPLKRVRPRASQKEISSLLDEGRYWEAFIAEGYEKGAGRAFEQVAAKRPRFGPGEGQFFQGAKTQFLAESFTSAVAVDKVKLIAGRVFTDLRDITDTMSTQMSRVLADGLATGASPREVARKMNAQVDLGRARSLRIARTETVRAHAEGQLDALERLGVEEVGVAVEWTTSGMGETRLGNPSPCPLCAPLQGTVMTIKEARGLLPRHPNSLTGDTVVNASGVVTLVEATYTGNLVTITTASGKTVSTTENHIHLTQFGFLQARFLQQGMNLLDASKGYSMLGQVNNNNTGVTRIADIFKTLSPFATVEVREPGAMDFHGDGEGMHEEVRIIRTDGVLWGQLRSEFGRVELEETFPLVDFVGVNRLLTTESPRTTFLKGVASTFDRSMGLCRDSLSLFLGCLTQPESSSLSLGTDGDSISFKSPSDDRSATPKMLRDCLNAHPFLKQFDNLIDWDNCLIPLRSIPRDTQSIQTPFNGITFNPESFSQSLPSLSTPVTLDQIVNVKIEHVESLPVYDMQTQSSLIIADGVTMSQCMCTYIPANVGEDRAQKKSQTAVRKAVQKSVRAEKGKGTLEQKKKRSEWPGAGKRIAKTRPRDLTK